MGISDENKLLARSALTSFGGKPVVNKYWDSNKSNSVDLLAVINSPLEKVNSYCTLGLSDYPIGYEVDGIPLRVEIVGAMATIYDQFPNAIVTCAFNIINSGFSISHGEIHLNIIKMYYPKIEMKHIIFLAPFLWEGLKTLDFPSKKVAWLLAVPISENEYKFAQDNGTESLEELLEKNEVDIFDLSRKSTI